MTGMLDGVEHRGQQQCRGDRPGVPAAFAALHDHRVGAPRRHLARVLGETDGRNHHGAGLFELADQFLLGRQRERRDLHAFADHQIHPVGGVAGVGADVHAERLVGGCFDLPDRDGQLVERHGRRSEDAEPARVGCRRDQPRAGHPSHTGLDDRVFDADQLGERCTQLHHDSDLAIAQRFRVDDLADQS